MLGLGFGFGIGNLIGGAAGTVDPCGRKTPVLIIPVTVGPVHLTETSSW